MRLYQVELADNQERLAENELRQVVYRAYKNERVLVTEEKLVKLLKTGRVLKVEYAGMLETE